MMEKPNLEGIPAENLDEPSLEGWLQMRLSRTL